MNKIKRVFVSLLVFATIGVAYSESKLVILHTNDTHSQIEPNDKNLGGVIRRKALIDSVKSEHSQVLVVDAGDAVQGTTYFNLYKGEAEQRVMNELGYDLRIVGNHEFDNGIDGVKLMLREANATFISTNYLFEDSMLRARFVPYKVYTFGEKTVGFIALNIKPQGLISEGNYDGVIYQDAFLTANNVAKQLKEQKGIDIVVAITHLGYSDDIRLAEMSSDIDIIIGGHTHTLIDAKDINNKLPYKVNNVNGQPVIVAQADKTGRYVGEVIVDFEANEISSKVIKVDSRLDNRGDVEALNEIISPYKHGVDLLMSKPVVSIAMDMKRDEAPLQNLVCDMIYTQAKKLYEGKIDLAISNKGGIRCDLTKGVVSVGNIMSMLPFNNRIVVVEIKGSDLLSAFDVMARRGGDCVSAGVEAIIDSKTKKCISVKINGEQINPEQIYILATIDYLANGGDYMTSLTNGLKIAASGNVLYDEMIDFMKSQDKMCISEEPRMTIK